MIPARHATWDDTIFSGSRWRRQHKALRPHGSPGGSRTGGCPRLKALAGRLASLGDVAFNPYMLKFRAADRGIVLFADGRAIIKGTSDEAAARALYARFIGA